MKDSTLDVARACVERDVVNLLDLNQEVMDWLTSGTRKFAELYLFCVIYLNGHKPTIADDCPTLRRDGYDNVPDMSPRLFPKL